MNTKNIDPKSMSVINNWLYVDEKTMVFIDGANLYATSKALNLDIDYKALRKLFNDNSRLIRMCYYTAILSDVDSSFVPIKPLIDWLGYNMYNTITKSARKFTDHEGRNKIKGNMDVEITVDVMSALPGVDHIVLITGDGDFTALVKAVQRKSGVRVSVVSTIATQPVMVADELRRECDVFVDLNDLAPLVSQVKDKDKAATIEDNDSDTE